MSKFKMLKDKNRLKDSGEKGSQQGEGRIPGRADPLPGPSVQLELGLRFLQQIQAVIFQKAEEEDMDRDGADVPDGVGIQDPEERREVEQLEQGQAL